MRLGLAAGALTLLVALSGCGSSSSSTPSKQQYLAKVDAVCRKLEQQAGVLTGNSQPFLSKIREVMHAKELGYHQIRAIRMPAQSSVPSEWLHWSELANSAVDEILKTKPHTAANAAANERQFKAAEKARTLARSYGLQTCIRL